MLGFPLGIAYSNAMEWVLHRYVLHGWGKSKNSPYSFHWKSHHRNARRFAMVDPEYEKPIWNWQSRGREIASIAAVVALHTPLVVVSPWFTAALWYSGFNYLHRHKKCHTDVEWGRIHMRHHYDHHMGQDQDTNWCVTRPWFDWVMGTRVEYADPLATPAPQANPAVDSASDLLRPLDPRDWSTAASNEAEATPSKPPKAA
jgi:Fatty acid hydroxylase superfamily